MRILIENFGPIARAEFDLTKDINVVFGKNNIGKSYAMTAVYLVVKQLLGMLSESADVYSIVHQVHLGGFGESRQPQVLDRFIDQVQSIFRQEPQTADVVITTAFEDLLKECFSLVFDEQLSDSFNNSFASINQLAANSSRQKLVIKISTRFTTLYLGAQDNKLVLERAVCNKPVVGQWNKMHRSHRFSDEQITLYFDAKPHETIPTIDIPAANHEASDVLFHVLHFFQDELVSVAEYVYFLPASRSGLYQALSAFGGIVAELSKSRRFTTRNISLPSISEPVADYFLHLSNATDRPSRPELYQLGQQMEQELLGGEVSVDLQTKKLLFTEAKTATTLDLAFTSSMISEIAPIAAYLKYVLPELRANLLFEPEPGEEVTEDDPRIWHTPTTLIFIEEPEAHLHPGIQVKLMEFFARLTKCNVRVMMTTHSNYLFNKLSNMVLKGELTEQQVGSHLMRATPTGSVMDSDAMQAIAGEGIPDENFVDVAEQLYNERLQAYDDQAAAPPDQPVAP